MACAEVVEGSSAQVNVASVREACVVTFGRLEEGKAAGELLDTSPTAQVEAGRGEGQSQDPVEGKQKRGPGLAVHQGALGRTGAHHWGVRAEVGSSHLGGWRWELKKKYRNFFLFFFF